MTALMAPVATRDDLLTRAAAAELSMSLTAGDERRAYLAAETLWRSTGSAQVVYEQIASQLARAADPRSAGSAALHDLQRLVVACERVCARLRPLPPERTRGTVVVAVPPGDPHQLSLHALAHLFEERGYRAVVAGGLPWEALAELVAAEPDVLALALSLHQDLPLTEVRRGIVAVRQTSRHTAVLVGGPLVTARPDSAARLGADVVAGTVDRALEHLDRVSSRLTDREREVLGCIADGMTNAEVARHLGLGAATVKSHLDHVFLKTGTTQRAAAVATALRRGWLA